MSDRQLVTRRTLQRAMILNAATKPIALAVATSVIAAALLFGVVWLVAAGITLYLALATATFFDGDEAERVGREVYARARPRRELPKTLAPEIASLVESARIEERRINKAIDDSGVAFGEVSAEVESLMDDMERMAAGAQMIWDYLSQQQPYEVAQRIRALEREQTGPPEIAHARGRAAEALKGQLRAREVLEGEYAHFRAEMEHLVASLGIVHAQLVRMSVADGARIQRDLAEDVRQLRTRVGSVADVVSDAAAKIDDDVTAT